MELHLVSTNTLLTMSSFLCKHDNTFLHSAADIMTILLAVFYNTVSTGCFYFFVCIVMFVGLNMSQLLCGIVYVYIIIHLYGYADIKLLQYMTYTL